MSQNNQVQVNDPFKQISYSNRIPKELYTAIAQQIKKISKECAINDEYNSTLRINKVITWVSKGYKLMKLLIIEEEKIDHQL